MLKLSCPNNNQAEKTYIATILLDEYLGLDYQLEFKTQEETILELANGKTLIIADHFFNQYPTNKSYLVSEALPTATKTTSHSFFPEPKLPILFGQDEIKESTKSLHCEIDIFASCFFMLSRWEEYVNKNRDQHNRFAAKDAIATKFNFLHRPIVNEYVEGLWKMLQHLGIAQKRKTRQFTFLPTHDVDIPLLWPKNIAIVKTLGGSLLKRQNIDEAFYHFKQYKRKLSGGKDPFDTFDFLMDQSEKHGWQSHFFFMSGGLTAFDNYYSIKDPFIKDLMNRIHQRGHQIGFHPSFDAYKNEAQFAKELDLLKSVSPQAIQTGRQHFLRFEVPYTWRIWESNKMEWDSTLSFADQQGFRCGTCWDFPVFDILDRKQLQLRERPLIVMEGSYVNYNQATPAELLNGVLDLMKTVQRYQGTFILLWHNTAFHAYEWKEYVGVYEKILEHAASY